MRWSLANSSFRLLAWLALLAMPVASLAQAGRIDLPSFDELARKASDTVNISLDPSLLKLAAQYMSGGANDAALQAALSGIEGVYVRSFQFAVDHAYPQSDMDRVRKELAGPGWNKLVDVHDSRQSQDVEICVHRQGGHTDGLVVIAAQPRQFTIVNIVGSVDLATLSQLEGKFGIPSLPLGQSPNGP